MNIIKTAHDGLSKASFMLAAFVLAFISVAYCYEVVSRYFFNAPTIWASPLVSYGLCLTIFLALPDMTRRGMHVSVDLHESWFTPATTARLLRATSLIAAACCFLAAWITGEQAWEDFSFGTFTNSYVPIPKWWLFIVIPYGLLSGGIYFLRQGLGEPAHPSEEA
ncbi:TRAP transporter small permease [Microbacteriaceae bacterium K1510]|nr:TRAP transporter small permease [Microbacteriaceae bacterium K1510]